MSSRNSRSNRNYGDSRKGTPTISDFIQRRRKEGRPYVPGELSECILQCEMAKHNFTKKQSLAGLFAFSRVVRPEA